MKYFDRVKETSTTTGTGDFTLAGAATGFRTFASVLSTSDTCYYCIAIQGGSEWEVGLGTYSASNTLTRTTVLSSSNSGSAVNFSSGTKDVFLTVAAQEVRRPAFKANKNGTLQNGFNNATWTKVTYTNEVFDTAGFYDAANSKFLPSVAGLYQIVGMIRWNALGGTQGIGFYKNGVLATEYISNPGSGYNSHILTDFIYLDGVDDYVEVYAVQYSGGNNKEVRGEVEDTFFSGILVSTDV